MQFYRLGNTSVPTVVSYSEVYNRAKSLASWLRSLNEFRDRDPVLVHFDNHSDTILWFWAVLLANGVPVISTPLSKIDEQLQRHLAHLSSLFERPICVTSTEWLYAFDRPELFSTYTDEHPIRSPEKSEHSRNQYGCLTSPGERLKTDDGRDSCFVVGKEVAFMMLTSGSTGNPKAVCLSHCQVLAAVQGKASIRPIPEALPFMNWIGLDHVASLVEIHLLAIFANVGQIHVHAADMVTSPATFLDIMSRHRVSRTFAPNFFLAKITPELESSQTAEPWDLRHLTLITSGGEANTVSTCVTASAVLQRYGAPPDVIVPGFGMTETCAGAIFNLNCPEDDIKGGKGIASLGRCMKGMYMRTTTAISDADQPPQASKDRWGHLELRGEAVFGEYYREPKATSEAFTADGWFRTGDYAAIDECGNLHLVGRSKDMTNINGVKIPSDQIQGALEQALRSHVARVFSFPSQAAHTEQVTVAYIPKDWPTQPGELEKVDERAVQACVACTGQQPVVFALGKDSIAKLPTSSLGKVSRDKLRFLFETGVFQQDKVRHDESLQRFRKERGVASLSKAIELEKDLIHDMAKVLNIDTETVGVDTSLFLLGCTSMDLVRLKYCIDSRLNISIPVVMLMRNPTASALAIALVSYLGPQPQQRPQQLHVSAHPIEVAHDPVIPLRPEGSKTPLWLVHPGVGEILVFLGLASHMSDDDRPVYALRARGFEPGQQRFASIAEAVGEYVGAIRQRQARGPYALAGYSYGAMLAFEMAKKLEEQDGSGSVRFLGSFNLPPHIKSRMRSLNWNMCLLHLSFFLELITEHQAELHQDAGFQSVSQDEALGQILELADQPRLKELNLGRAELARWSDVAFGLQVSIHLSCVPKFRVTTLTGRDGGGKSMAVDYEPQGLVSSIDVFHCIPLKVAAASRQEWLSEHLSRWRDFCSTETRYHGVGGAHYTMLGREHAAGFSVILKAALRDRGL